MTTSPSHAGASARVALTKPALRETIQWNPPSEVDELVQREKQMFGFWHYFAAFPWWYRLLPLIALGALAFWAWRKR
jgi:hypothetical protein